MYQIVTDNLVISGVDSFWSGQSRQILDNPTQTKPKQGDYDPLKIIFSVQTVFSMKHVKITTEIMWKMKLDKELEKVVLLDYIC